MLEFAKDDKEKFFDQLEDGCLHPDASGIDNKIIGRKSSILSIQSKRISKDNQLLAKQFNKLSEKYFPP